MADKDETTRRFSDQPEWVAYLLSRVDALTDKAEALAVEVSGLRVRFDARERETKPLNETLQAFRAEIRELREGQDKLREGQDKLREGQDQLREGQEEMRKDMRDGLKSLERKLDAFNKRWLEVRADLAWHDERLLALEGQGKQ